MAPRRDVLLDTGPLVAILDGRDTWHQVCADAWYEVAERCVTTEAVVTEACHLVARGGGPAHVALDFLLAAGVPIVGLEKSGHEHAVRLMRRYADVPMDYADATLVVSCDALAIRNVLTLNRRGFGTYRRSSGERFSMLPVR